MARLSKQARAEQAHRRLAAFLGLFLALFFGVILGSACVVGLWLYSKFRPLSLTGKNLNPSCKDAAPAANPPNLG